MFACEIEAYELAVAIGKDLLDQIVVKIVGLLIDRSAGIEVGLSCRAIVMLNGGLELFPEQLLLIRGHLIDRANGCRHLGGVR